MSLIPVNIIFFLTFIVFLNQKDEIFEYIKNSPSLRKKFFELIETDKSEGLEFDQVEKIDEIHDLLENDTGENEKLSIHNFMGGADQTSTATAATTCSRSSSSASSSSSSCPS